MNVIEFTPLSVGDYVMPPWAQLLGWLMALVPVFTIIVCAIYSISSSHTNPEYDGLTVWEVRMVDCFIQRISVLSHASLQKGVFECGIF